MGSLCCCSIRLCSSFSHIKGQIKLVVNKKEVSEIHGPRMSDYLKKHGKVKWWPSGILLKCPFNSSCHYHGWSLNFKAKVLSIIMHCLFFWGNSMTK